MLALFDRYIRPVTLLFLLLAVAFGVLQLFGGDAGAQAFSTQNPQATGLLPNAVAQCGFTVKQPNGTIILGAFCDGGGTTPGSSGFVTQGQFDAGIWGTIPGKASGLAANSQIASTAVFTYGAGDADYVDFDFPDAGKAVYVGVSSGTPIVASPTGTASFLNGSFGSFSTFPNFAVQIAGTAEIYGPLVMTTTGFSPYFSISQGAGGFPMVGDGAGYAAGSVQELIVKDATDPTHAATLGQVKAVEQTISSVSVGALLVASTTYGGHKLGASGFTVSALTWTVSVAGTGAGTINFRVSDGTNNCDTAMVCNATGIVRTTSTGTCALAAGASLSYATTTTTGTCTILPTVRSIDVVGHPT